MPSNPLPRFYYIFFGFFEPTLILIGAYLCIATPEAYADSLFPTGLEKVTRIMGATSRGQMVIGGLGSCFFLLAMLALSMFPLIKNNLGGNPIVQGKMVRGLLIPLAIADLSHIAVTLLPLPMSFLKSPSQWTGVLHANVSMTLILFGVRMAYFLGIGRSQKQPISTSGQRKKSFGQSTVPLPGGSRADVVKAVEEVEASPVKKRGGKVKA